jgi:choice-of-anchor B domain-containing protein
MLKIFYTIMILFCISNFAIGQNIEKIDSFPGPGNMTDCWGYDAPDGRFYAIFGAFNGTSVLDVTDPEAIKEVGFVPGPQSNWRDIKVYKHYAYITNETKDLAIIDLSSVPTSIRHVKDMIVQNFHNLFIDTTTAHMYLCDASSSFGKVQIYSLADPEDPQYVNQFGTETHDVYVRNGVAYTAEGGKGTLGFYNVSNPASPSLIKKHNIPNSGYVHNVWLTKNSDYLVSTEENPNKTIKVWDISDLDNLELVSEYLGPSQLAHNVHVEGDYAFVSHYESGVSVLDLHNPQKAAVVGLYDSYPTSDTSSFNGAWGVYPHSKSGNIYLSDRSNGLFVLKFNNKIAGFIEGTISDKDTGLPLQNARVQFTGNAPGVLSDNSGNYIIGSGLSENDTIKVSATGYKTFLQEVTLVSGQTQLLDIELENILTAIDENQTANPRFYQLKQNYPNPFNPSTTIEYNLPENANVKIEVFSLTGKKIKTLVNGLQNKGLYSVTFDAENLVSGIYFYKLETKQFTEIKRMILIQ